MRQRLLATIGQPAYYVNISTFHSFCSSVIQEFADRFAISLNLEPLSELERVDIFNQILSHGRFKAIKPANSPLYYTPSLIESIKDLKREAVSPITFAAIVKKEKASLVKEKNKLSATALLNARKTLDKNYDLARVYQTYQKLLAQKGRYDFEDMINFVAVAFKQDTNILRTHQERLLYFLVDEYQDTNSAQNQVLQLLASYWGDQANVFVVGDPNQCLPAGIKINTKSGLKNIEKIKAGDEVLTAVGKGYTSYAKVKRVFKQKRKVRLITFTTESGQKIATTDNHKMFCFIPPREMTNIWYVYLMYKKSLGWRLGITRSLSVRLKIEAGADKIIGLSAHKSEAEARYREMVLSLTYKIPTVVFQERNNAITGKWLKKLYQEFDTEKNAAILAQDLGVNLNQPHYIRDATTLGDGRIKINLVMCSRNYRSKYDKKGLLQSPSILHELRIQTSNKKIIKKLNKLGFKLRNKNIGKGFRLNNTDFSQLYKIAEKLERKLPGIIDIKAPLGTTRIQHRPSRIMQAGNILVGNYLPVVRRHKVIYDKVIKREKKIKTINVYDLEVPPSHNFVANNVVVHNSIFRFQGASTENFIAFNNLFPQAQVIELAQNYRSTQTILDASAAVIKKNQLQLKKATTTLKSQGKFKEQKLSLVRFPSETLETFWLAREIDRLIKSGTKPESIAVLFRHNADAGTLAEMLTKFGVSLDIEGGGNVLIDPVVNQFLLLLKVISDAGGGAGDDLDLFTLLNYQFLKLDALDILKLSRAVAQADTNLVDFILSPQFKKLKLKSGSKITKFIGKLSDWRKLDAEKTFSQFFEMVLKQSGFLSWLETLPDSVEKLNRLNSLFAEVKSLNQADHSLNLVGFIKALELMEQNRLSVVEQDLDIKTNAVTLSTVHKAKGREWDYVFIYRAIDKKWGNNRTRELIKLPQGILSFTDLQKKEKNEDERRLFYVGLTRARKKVCVTYADRYSGSVTGKEAVPSMFVSEIPQKYLEPVSPQLTKQAKQALTKLLKPLPQVTPSVKESDFLNLILKDFKLSATALNTYLACSYKFKLNNLIRVPRAKQAYLSFGTAVHKALEIFYRRFLKTNRLPAKEFLLSQFKKALGSEVLTPVRHADFIDKGVNALAAYYRYYHQEMTKPLAVELRFGGFYSKPYLDDIPLSGKIDRVDLIDKTKKTIKVTDYKTGPTKSANDILGQTKTSSGDLFRQLVFYRLLFAADPRLSYKVLEAELDFVESGLKKTKFVKRSFDIPDDQVAKLMTTIKSSMKAIRRHRFARTTDYQRHCLRCEYRRHCWPLGLPTDRQDLPQST